MTEVKTIKNYTVNNDSDLIKKFLEVMNDIEYIKEDTKISIRDIKHEVSLNFQNNELLIAWELLLGDAIVFLKSKDEREIIHDNMSKGLEKLCEYIKEYKEFEHVFYGIKKNYRDHIEHVFRTFLLGDYLIRNSYNYEKISPTKSDLIISKEEKEAMWCIISLCHDVGYPLEAIQDINEPVRKILKIFGYATISEFGYTHPLFSNISEFAIKFMSSDLQEIKNRKGKSTNKYLTHLQPKYFQKFSSAFSNYNHGVLSAILLMKDLVYFKESDYTFDEFKQLDEKDARHFLIRRNIIRAIATHSCDDIYYLKGNDFNFILKVIDEMQEWGRPRLIDVIDREGCTKKLKVNKFNDKHIKYTITFECDEYFERRASDQEKEQVRKEIISYFITKCNEWRNVLRSAVGGDHRDLILEFIVISDIPPKEEKYSLYHPNPDPKKIKIEPKNIRDKTLKLKSF